MSSNHRHTQGADVMAKNEGGWPVTKAELMARMRQRRALLEQTLAGLDEAALSRPVPDGWWAVKDHLSHLASWHTKVLALIANEPPWEGLDIDEHTYETAGEDGINAILHARHRDWPAQRALDAFRGTYDRLWSALEGLGEEALHGPYVPSDPADHRTLMEGIAGNTYQHYDEHRQWIKEALAMRPD